MGAKTVAHARSGEPVRARQWYIDNVQRGAQWWLTVGSLLVRVDRATRERRTGRRTCVHPFTIMSHETAKLWLGDVLGEGGRECMGWHGCGGRGKEAWGTRMYMCQVFTGRPCNPQAAAAAAADVTAAAAADATPCHAAVSCPAVWGKHALQRAVLAKCTSPI